MSLCERYYSDRSSAVETHHRTSAIVVRFGTDALVHHQSETLKQDFMHLVNSLLDTGKQCIMSAAAPLIFA